MNPPEGTEASLLPLKGPKEDLGLGLQHVWRQEGAQKVCLPDTGGSHILAHVPALPRFKAAGHQEAFRGVDRLWDVEENVLLQGLHPGDAKSAAPHLGQDF